MPFVFLDIDGVLNSKESFHKKFIETGTCLNTSEHVSNVLVEHLNTLIDKTNASIVISSAWRLCFDITKIKKVLEASGFRHNDKIVGCTPLLRFSCFRGLEIQTWMESHGVHKHEIVILDDNSDMVHLMDRLVQTDFNIGLTKKNVKEAISLLNRKRV